MSRRWLAACLVVLSGVAAGTWEFSNAAPTAGATGLPLYAYAKTSSGLLPWDATALTSDLAGSSMIAGPTSFVSDDGATYLGWLAPSRHAFLDVIPAAGLHQTIDVQSLADGVPAANSAPVVVLDADGQRRVLFTTADDHLIVVSEWLDPSVALASADGSASTATWTWRDLTSATGTTMSGGVSAQLLGSTLYVIGLDATGTVQSVAIPTWFRIRPSSANGEALASLGAGAVSVAWLPGTTTAVAVAANRHVDAISYGATCWTTEPTSCATTTTDLTAQSGTAAAASPVTVTSSNTGYAVGVINANGQATIFTSNATSAPWVWTASTVPASANGPALSGSPFIAISNGVTTFAARASNWGDLIALSNDGVNGAWRSVDVSATGGTNAKTVGGVVTGSLVNGVLTIYAGGVAQPAPKGVGVYAIPSASWSTAITDGWPILSITGGLGTPSSPWVQVKSRSSDVASSADFLFGQTIQNTHHRVTWISFWTVSGPSRGEAVTPAVYYQHAFTAGAAVAAQIDQYRGLGVGLKPDWVVIDPEGYPDLHSCMDGPNGYASWCAKASATTWASYVNGWAAGLHSVDGTLNAGVYASQSEIRMGSLGQLTVPVFVATAFTWATVTATISLPVGSTSINVNSNLGVNPNEQLWISDGANSELVTIASTYNGNDLKVPLVAPTKKSHHVSSWILGTAAVLGDSSVTLTNVAGLRANGTYWLSDTGERVTIAPTYNGTDLVVPLTTPLLHPHAVGVALASGTTVMALVPPTRLSSTVGSNIFGYIAFGSSTICAAVPYESSFFVSSPWNGLYNTLQFDGGAYCRPTGL